jgi:hypothetical protein
MVVESEREGETCRQKEREREMATRLKRIRIET